ncbi:enhanced disease resistance 2-like protein [Tanacetum coccineum]
MELQDMDWDTTVTHSYGSTLLNDLTCNTPCTWTTSDPSLFLVRGPNNLKDNQKNKAKGTMMEMFGADWLQSDKREDDLAGHPGGIVQKYATHGVDLSFSLSSIYRFFISAMADLLSTLIVTFSSSECVSLLSSLFNHNACVAAVVAAMNSDSHDDSATMAYFCVLQLIVPGASTYNLVLYYMTRTPLEESVLLERFVNGDDAFRNSRFKLIPYISKGSWLVKQSVGKKACLVGQALEVTYYRGENYLELDIDVGSSTVARGVVNLVLGYLNNLIVEMAFLIQANSEDELPESLLGTCRLNHMDTTKSVSVDSINK